MEDKENAIRSYEEGVAEQILSWAEGVRSFKLSDCKNKFMTINLPILQDACNLLVARKKLESGGGRIAVYQLVSGSHSKKAPESVAAPKPKLKPAASTNSKPLQQKQPAKRPRSDSTCEVEPVTITELSVLPAQKKPHVGETAAPKLDSSVDPLRSFIVEQSVASTEMFLELALYLREASRLAIPEDRAMQLIAHLESENKVMLDGDTILFI